ncbi:hypothetical protein JXA85_07170 [Candidatus Woesearchaeota archaeon]|nr:hypothetical protein [Candidatus Woesearchaeota archaeon]
MSFFCVKTVTRKPSSASGRKNARSSEKKYMYVYEAETKRDGQKIKHRILERVGPFVKLKKEKNVSFDTAELSKLERRELIKEVLRQNIIAHGMNEAERDIFEKEGCEVNLRNLRVTDNIGKAVVIGINDGYLCTKTLERLFYFELKSQADLPVLVKYVRDIGLLPTKVKQEEELDIKNVEGLIKAIGKALGDGPKEKTEMDEVIEKHQAFFSILVTKYPGFKPPEIKTEEMPISKFRQEIGW